MEYVHQTIGSSALDGIIELPPNLRNRSVQVIVLPAESNAPKAEPKREIQFGFLKGIVPPLPDSFFDPLPEEELQAWGL
jgi:hypothetical protein